ncbi:MAG: hypothetical protein IKF52_01730 [Clostridia bacterium]|nr:hypothetical protein [Clostridia bacterium]
MSKLYSSNYFYFTNAFPKTGVMNAQEFIGKIQDLADERHAQLAPVSANAPIAHIILGYPGNGKTSYVQKISKPNDAIFSTDSLRGLIRYEQNVSTVSDAMYLGYFDTLLDNFVSTRKNIWFDGIFLNIYLRMTLITTMHEYGYQVHIHSLLNDEFMNKCFNARIRDISYSTGRSPESVFNEFVYTLRKIKEDTLVDLQESLNLFPLHSEKFITY